MDLYLDSADVSAIPQFLATGVFKGVTTNPLILGKSGYGIADAERLVRKLSQLSTTEIFYQVLTATADEIEREAYTLYGWAQNLIIKVPATPQGIEATKRLTTRGIPVLVTAVYHPKQALTAHAVGAWGIAPYVGRITDSGRDGVREVARMQRMLAGSDTRVLAASIRSIEVLCDLADSGIDAATFNLDIARDLLNDELTQKAVEEFDRAFDD